MLNGLFLFMRLTLVDARWVGSITLCPRKKINVGDFNEKLSALIFIVKADRKRKPDLCSLPQVSAMSKHFNETHQDLFSRRRILTQVAKEEYNEDLKDLQLLHGHSCDLATISGYLKRICARIIVLREPNDRMFQTFVTPHRR